MNNNMDDLLINFIVFVAGGLLLWILQMIIKKMMYKPKLRFELHDNDNFKGLDSTTPAGESEYDILCHNDNKQEIKIINIFLKDKQVDICDFKNVSFVITPLGTYSHHIDSTRLGKIEKYYREQKIEECTILVDTNNGKHSYKLGLTKFDDEYRGLGGLIRGATSRI